MVVLANVCVLTTVISIEKRPRRRRIIHMTEKNYDFHIYSGSILGLWKAKPEYIPMQRRIQSYSRGACERSLRKQSESNSNAPEEGNETRCRRRRRPFLFGRFAAETIARARMLYEALALHRHHKHKSTPGLQLARDSPFNPDDWRESEGSPKVKQFLKLSFQSDSTNMSMTLRLDLLPFAILVIPLKHNDEV